MGAASPPLPPVMTPTGRKGGLPGDSLERVAGRRLAPFGERGLAVAAETLYVQSRCTVPGSGGSDGGGSDHENIAIGTEHLARLIGRFPSLPHALAAYNAGEGHVQRWMTGSYLDLDEFVEDIPFAETRNYVLKVLRSYQINKHLYGAAPEETIPREEMF